MSEILHLFAEHGRRDEEIARTPLIIPANAVVQQNGWIDHVNLHTDAETWQQAVRCPSDAGCYKVHMRRRHRGDGGEEGRTMTQPMKCSWPIISTVRFAEAIGVSPRVTHSSAASAASATPIPSGLETIGSRATTSRADSPDLSGGAPALSAPAFWTSRSIAARSASAGVITVTGRPRWLLPAAARPRA